MLTRYHTVRRHLRLLWFPVSRGCASHPCQDGDYKQRLSRSLAQQKQGELDGPWLWLHPVTPCEEDLEVDDTLQDTESDVDVPLVHSSLSQYVETLRHSLPDQFRPAMRGELRLHTPEEHNYLLPGTLSMRMHLKQANAHLQTRLSEQPHALSR